jgi:phosphotransferase system enzyme I (PtsI)
MLLLEGIPISPGFASGIAVVYDFDIQRRLELPHRAISRSEVDTECERLDDALEQSGQDLRHVEQTALQDPRLIDSAALISAHLTMANEIAALVKQHVGREFVNVERALDSVIRNWAGRLEGLDNAYFRQREQDVRDVGRRMMRNLAGSLPWTNEPLPPGTVIVARELLPSETVELARSGVVAIVCEHGGKYSHTAIVARSLGIPAITGISNVTSQIQPGVRLLVDGATGSVMIAPSPSDEESFVNRKREYESLAASITADEKLACVTQDGIEISLLANIGLPDEVEGVTEHNLAGIGLFRTEFLFLESHERPGFQMQSEMYDSIVSGLDDLPLTVRTFDHGADKLPPFLLSEGSDTRASLHSRGLRFSLSEQHLLDTQLRAILYVAQSSDVRILFPMVIGSDDFARAIAAVDRVVDQLGVRRRPPLGAMIETPAALYFLDEILDLADFVAIGTNDLAQYMLAADRDVAEGTDDCTALHPAVLRAIKQVVEAAEKRQCPVCVCGEEAGDADFACLLVGLGIRELSLSPCRGATVRQAIRGINFKHAREIADQALRCRSPGEVRELLSHLRSRGASGDTSSPGAAPTGVEVLGR